MPSGNPKLRPIRSIAESLRGQKYRLSPEFHVTPETFAAAQLTGATSGFYVFVAPFPMIFLGADILWATAGTNTLRVKKVLAATVGAAGAAADAGNVDISSAADLTLAANTVRNLTPVTTGFVNTLAAGDKVAIASALGTASLAGAKIVLRFAAL